MRILWYNWRDIRNPDAGGAEVFTHEVCKRLVKMDGIDSITLFAASFPGCNQYEVVDGVRIVRDGSKYSVYKKAKELKSGVQAVNVNAKGASTAYKVLFEIADELGLNQEQDKTKQVPFTGLSIGEATSRILQYIQR